MSVYAIDNIYLRYYTRIVLKVLIMTTIEAAEKLGVSDARVRQLILDGKLKAERIGERLLDVNAASLNALAARREKQKAARLEKLTKKGV
jgi:excisionase family DNA binding protein